LLGFGSDPESTSRFELALIGHFPLAFSGGGSVR
jgi:hypothetical protein